MTLVNVPAITDDDGTGRVGTVIDSAWMSDFADAIDALTHSTANPAVTPKTIIDEVVSARGNKAALDTRLSVGLDADGNLILTGLNLAYQKDVLCALGQRNIVYNDTFEIWPVNDSSAPAGWTLGGAGSIARSTVQTKHGRNSALVTYGAPGSFFYHYVLNSTEAASAGRNALAYIRGKYLHFGAWIYPSAGNIARLRVYDGAGTYYSSYATSAGAWQWVSFVQQISGSATQLQVGLDLGGAGTAYLSGVTGLLTLENLTYKIQDWVPSPVVPVEMQVNWHVPNGDNTITTWTAGTPRPFYINPSRPMIVENVSVGVDLTPTNSFYVDALTWDGAAFTSMFNGVAGTGTRPAVTSGGSVYGQRQPDGTYARRCTRGTQAGGAGQILLNLTTAAGAGPTSFNFCVQGRRHARFLEIFNDLTTHGEA